MGSKFLGRDEKAGKAEGEDLYPLAGSVFASRADRCDVQTKSGIRRMRAGREDEDGGCGAHDGRDLPRLTRKAFHDALIRQTGQ